MIQPMSHMSHGVLHARLSFFMNTLCYFMTHALLYNMLYQDDTWAGFIVGVRDFWPTVPKTIKTLFHVLGVLHFHVKPFSFHLGHLFSNLSGHLICYYAAK